jgi:phosphatidylserine/phosphatidylglycerophosphate/cardiolipin synthase-like enzyme
MFDLGYLTGISYHEHHETDVITALINARNRGVRVKIILNGMIAHTGPLPEPWDLNRSRPLKDAVQRLKDAWMEINCIYYRESIYSPLHHKFAVFDGHTVITGSYNWYEASVQSDEVLVVIRDRGIANAFIEESVRLCNAFRTGYE